MKKLFFVVLLFGVLSCKKGDDSTLPNSPSIKTAWATQAERDLAFQNWASKVSGKTFISVTSKSDSSWPYGLSDLLVSTAINESGFTPGTYDAKTNPGGYEYESFLKVNRWLPRKAFIGPDKYVMDLFLSDNPSKRTVTASFGYELDYDLAINKGQQVKLTVLPATPTGVNLSTSLSIIYSY